MTSSQSRKPEVLVFDVNETLIDIEALNPLFESIFGDRRVMREWFGQLVMYSMSITLSGLYNDFFSLGQGVLRMLADIHGIELTPAHLSALKEGMMSMPAHADCRAGLEQLRKDGFRLTTLTNSPPVPGGQSPLECSGLAGFFERRFSVDTAGAYKPSPAVYHMVAEELQVAPSSCCMVAAHVWDTMGAQSVGFTGALIKRNGNAPLPVAGLPQPTIIAPDLVALAQRMAQIWSA